MTRTLREHIRQRRSEIVFKSFGGPQGIRCECGQRWCSECYAKPLGNGSRVMEGYLVALDKGTASV